MTTARIIFQNTQFIIGKVLQNNFYGKDVAEKKIKN